MQTRTYTCNSQTAKFMGPIWGPPGSYRSQMGPILAPGALLSGLLYHGGKWKYKWQTELQSCSTYFMVLLVKICRSYIYIYRYKIFLSDYHIILCAHMVLVYPEQWCARASNISRQKVDFHHIVAAILQHALHFEFHMSPIYYMYIFTWHNKEDNSKISSNASFATTHRPICVYSFFYFKCLCIGIEIVAFD